MNAQINPLDELYPMSDLFALLHQIEPIGSHFRNLLPDCMMPIEGPFDKNTIALYSGEVSTIASWMPAGYARAFINVPGKEPWETKEVTTGFWKAGELMVIKDSFFLQKPSSHCLEFAAGTVLRSISYDALQVMKLKTIETYELIAKILADEYTKLAERVTFLRMTAKQRYAAFIEHFGAKIEQHFELRAIASYLDMDPTTLSILRR
jgi:hypothetical protein